jgi:glycerol-3-phosphate acyltransferase PlsX
MTIKISIDCMGGDHGPSVTIPAALAFLKREAEAELILVGIEEQIRAELKKHHVGENPRLSIKHAAEVVAMDDPIEVALRRKKDSSMRVAIELVKDGSANVCVSAGNTGALMAISRYVLKTMANVDRPAICSILPNQKGGPTYMLDLGANVDCEPHHLHQFAIMGAVLFEAMEHRRPSIGLLNVGTEEIKGTEIVKATATLLRADHERGVLNFHGNVEGNDIFKGTVDVVVCDGFVGNVTLKAVEGLSRLFKATLMETTMSKLGALLARKSLKKLNPESYNGAGLLGLKGLVFKSHGGAHAYAYEWAIRRAFEAAKYNVQEQLSTLIAEMLPDASVPEAPGSTIKQG